MGRMLDGIFGALAGPVADAAGGRVTPATLPLVDLASGERHYPDLTPDAYYSNAYRACELAKARPLAALPAGVYMREGGARRDATGRVAKALSRLLRRGWNPYLTHAEGVRWAVMTKDTLGNAFVRVEWSGGVPVALWPMSGEPDVSVSGGRAVFDYAGDSLTPAGRYLEHEVLWVKSPIIDRDGKSGVSLAELAARELGLSVDLEEFYARLISNSNHFPRWLETDKKLQQADVERISQQLADHRGLVSSGETRIFDNGLTVKQASLPLADMSLVEQQTWILQQTCRTLSVPPQEVFELSHATYSNIEQGAINFANKTLVPECRALEQALSRVLWSAGRDDCYVQFDLNGLMRGDYKTRMDGYRIGIYSGFLSPDEVRAWEDLPPYEGGERFLLPAAYLRVDPETGEVEAAQETAREAALAGGSGEGFVPTTGDGSGRPEAALERVHADMERRVTERFSERGDTPSTRDFAARVLESYADACLVARIPYDMQQDIERMAANA